MSLSNTTQTVTLMFSYPFTDGSFSFSYDPSTSSSDRLCGTRSVTDSQAFGGSSQFFVFMSVVSFIFGIVMVIVYIVTYSPKYQISKYIAIVVRLTHFYIYVCACQCAYCLWQLLWSVS